MGQWPSIEERLNAKLDKSGGPDACWIWRGSTTSGYGQIFHKGKMTRTHRVAFELANGPIPEGHDVCHKCDNPRCCRPEHLWLGTHQENMADRNKKGRNKAGVGERNGSAKLTAQDIPVIRDLYDNHNLTTKELSERFGVSQVAIYYVVARITWKQVA